MRRILHSIPQFRKYSHTAEFLMKQKICSNTLHQAEFQCGVPCWNRVFERFSTSGLRNSASSRISMRSSMLIRSIGTLFHILTAEFCIKRNFNAEFRVDTEYWNPFPHLDCGIPHQAEFHCGVPCWYGVLERFSTSGLRNFFQYSASSGISMRSSLLIRSSAFMRNVRKRFQIKFQITSKNSMQNSALCRFPQDFLLFCQSPLSKEEFFRP